MARTLTVALALALAALALAAAPASARVAYAIDGSTTLITFNTNAPGTITASVSITGLQPGETAEGIDVNPATGQLFALGSTSRLYTLNPTTGAATQVGTGTFTPALSGTDFGFDFNPVTDRIRVVSNTNQNIELLPATGQAISHGDIDPTVGPVGAAYSNNFAGATTTSLFDVSAGSSNLYTQSLVPDDGAVSLIGSTGVIIDPEVGFDIAADGTAFVAITSGVAAALSTVNLGTGVSTTVGTIGSGPGDVVATPGLAIARPLETSLISVAFGNEAVGATTLATPITVTNTSDIAIPVAPGLTGGQAAQFAIASDTCGTVIASGASCTIGVEFKPSQPGAAATTLSLNGSGQGNNATVPLTGTGIGASVALSAKSIAFGTQALHTSTAPSTVTVTNTGNSALTVSSVAIGGDVRDFALRSQTCTAGPIAPGGTCTIAVAFDPISSGAKAGHIHLVDNARNASDRIELSGTGASPKAVLSTTELTFPSTLTRATSPAQTVTVTNTGAAPLTISTLALSGAGTRSFDIGAQTCTAAPVAVGGSCTITVAFQPLTTGSLAATLHVVSNAPGAQPSVALNGRGTARAAAARFPGRRGFGAVAVGRSKLRTITVRSTGTASLRVRRLRVSGSARSQFRVMSQSCTAGTLAKGRRCTIRLRFRPTSAGRKTATLTIADNAPRGGRIALSGRGR